MWPFKKKKPAVQMIALQKLSFSQLDITQNIGDNLTLGPDEWIATSPLNASIPNPQAQGLPPVGASDGDTYTTAERLSKFRESVSVPNDGVYCPVCHVANVSLARLRTPCPKCGRPLLKFGWD